ncbi:hypothetical protein AK812_SmicGene16535 [Symbiodinium microadriaticum]|uniref:Uncharacterized protein n=1 Tax=Symbiodinium microadriaticum TaxID=2951 RepID=A0A1Q9E076_SYMMI|nr:hypothetical protein AK812_SmicGene16535 [Symbiodinium microadriaticum]
MPDVPRTPPWMLPTPVPFSHEIRLLPLITRVSDGSRSRSGRGGGSHQSHLQTIVSPAATATSSLFSFGFTQRMTPSPGLGGNGGTSPTAYQDSLLPLLGRVLLSSRFPEGLKASSPTSSGNRGGPGGGDVQQRQWRSSAKRCGAIACCEGCESLQFICKVRCHHRGG